jgi:hypothetical protein
MMNERIKELSEQAKQYMTEQVTFFFLERNKELTYNETANIFEQKFAELIVQECADAIIKDSRLSDVRSAANGCVRTIKQHFGVE